MTEHAHGGLVNPEVAHESSDISIKGVVWFVIILAGTAIAIQIAMYVMFIALDKIEVRNDPYVTPIDYTAGQIPPEPRLQTTPWEDLKQFVGSEQDYLNSYGWVDQGTGQVHIPIERAKELLLQRGIPARAPENGAPPDQNEGTHLASMGEASGGRNLPAGQSDRSSADSAVAPAAGTGTGSSGQTTAGKGRGGGR
jgi:hypothetical protein